MPKDIKDETWNVTPEDIKKGGKAVPLKVLKNLKPMVAGTDRAKEISQKGAEATKVKFAAQRALQAELKELSELTTKMAESIPNIDSYKFLQLVQLKYLQEEDYEKAERVATILLSYEKPKLSAVTQEVHEINTKDLTDEELEARLEALENPEASKDS